MPNLRKSYSDYPIPDNAKIYIGCDSHKFGSSTLYVCAVVIHTPKTCRVFTEVKSQEDYGVLVSRLLNEVAFAIEVAEDFRGHNVEVHLDINPDPHHKSYQAYKQAVAYVKGMGHEVRVKPEAFAATHVADHYVRGKNGKNP